MVAVDCADDVFAETAAPVVEVEFEDAVAVRDMSGKEEDAQALPVSAWGEAIFDQIILREGAVGDAGGST
jgi:hypothetical protein